MASLSALTRFYTALCGFLSLPPTLLHEATHAAVWWPWTQRYGYELTWTRARWKVDFEDDVPDWVVRLGYVAPTVVGFGTGAVVATWWLLSGGTLPDGGVSLAKLALAGIVWAVYTTPSPTDLRGALK